MKKVTLAILMALMLFLVACGGEAPEATEEAVEEAVETEVEEVAEEEMAEEAVEEAAEEEMAEEAVEEVAEEEMAEEEMVEEVAEEEMAEEAVEEAAEEEMAEEAVEEVAEEEMAEEAVEEAAEEEMAEEAVEEAAEEEMAEEEMAEEEMAEEMMIDPITISIVMPSATTDLAWSQAIYDALVNVQGMYDEGVVTIEFTEGMFVVTDAAAALRDYADGGADIVIAHGTQFGTSLFELAPDFEDTAFVYGTSRDTGEEEGLTNISAYDAQADEGGYVNGVIAASLSESGIIGVVGPVEAGDAKLYIDGFIAGATATNPDIEVLVAYTGSFGDTALAAEVAQTHIAAGADVLTGSAQQVVGSIGVAAEAGVPWLGTQSDQSPIAEDIVMATQMYDWTDMVLDVIEGQQAGDAGGDVYELTLENGGLKMLLSDNLPDEVKEAAQAAIDGIIAGEIAPLGE